MSIALLDSNSTIFFTIFVGKMFPGQAVAFFWAIHYVTRTNHGKERVTELSEEEELLAE